jgi:hypothetical protein
MGRPATVLPIIKSRLEPYLEENLAAWERQPASKREPTLPATHDGKVNVRALTQALGLKAADEQHFYRYPELASMVNAVAEAQGLRPIGSRAQIDAQDKVVRDRIVRLQSDRSDLARTLAEREAVIEAQRNEIAALREQLRLRDETGMTLRDGNLR